MSDERTARHGGGQVPGRARLSPSRTARKKIEMRVPESIYDTLIRLAAERNVSLNVLMNEFVEEHLAGDELMAS